MSGLSSGGGSVKGGARSLALDGGATFEPLLRQACLRGPLECAASMRVGALCPTDWPRIASMTGHKECSPDVGVARRRRERGERSRGGATAGSRGGAGAGAGGAREAPGGGASPSADGGCGGRAGGAGAG